MAYKHNSPRPGAQLKLPEGIPREFYNYWRSKQVNKHNGARMRMTLEQCWAKWEPYWSQRQFGPKNQIPFGETYVLARYGDKGDYTVDNCRVITHRENTLERDHSKLRDINRYKKPWVVGGNKTPRPVQVGDTVYDSAGGAAKSHGIHKSTVRNRCLKDSYPEWKSVEKKEGPV